MDFISFNSPASNKRSSDSSTNVKQNNTAGMKGTPTNTNAKPAFGSPAIAFGSPAIGFGSPAVSFGSPAISPHGGPSSKSNASPTKTFSPSQSKQQYTPNRHNSSGNNVSPHGGPACRNPALSKANSSPGNFNPNHSKQQYTPNRPDSTGSTVSPLAFGSPALSKANSSPANSTFSPNQSKQQYRPRRYNSTGSPHTYNNHSPNPRFQNSSPYSSSPNGTPGRQQYSNEGSHFKTPYQCSPGRGRGNGRGSTSGQSPYHRNLNPNGGVNVQDYYQPAMIEDPWRGMVAVPAQT